MSNYFIITEIGDRKRLKTVVENCDRKEGQWQLEEFTPELRKSIQIEVATPKKPKAKEKSE